MRSDSGRRRRTKEREECDVFLFLFFPSRLDPNVLFCFFLGLRFLGVDRAFSFFTEWARGRYGAPEKALAKRQARGGQQQGQSLYIEEERTRRERVRGEKKGGAIRKEERRKCLSLSLSVRARQKRSKRSQRHSFNHLRDTRAQATRPSGPFLYRRRRGRSRARCRQGTLCSRPRASKTSRSRP